MAEGSGSNNTPIWVALITVVGALLAAVIANADKWLMRGDDEPAAVASPAVVPASGAAAAPAVAAAGVREEGRALAAVPAASAPASSDPVAARPDLDGEWRDDEGLIYSFDQSGARFELLQMSPSGNTQLVGKGTIDGRDLSYTYEMMTGETGSCSARVNAAGNRITGNCIWPEGGWTYAIER